MCWYSFSMLFLSLMLLWSLFCMMLLLILMLCASLCLMDSFLSLYVADVSTIAIVDVEAAFVLAIFAGVASLLWMPCEDVLSVWCWSLSLLCVDDVLFLCDVCCSSMLSLLLLVSSSCCWGRRWGRCWWTSLCARLCMSSMSTCMVSIFVTFSLMLLQPTMM